MQLFEKYGTLIERNTALIEKVSPCRVNASTWIPAGAMMNGMDESWPPAEPATTFVIDGTDWPGVDW
eukprot:SAG31_NODE_3465_length_4243_cov_8.202220_5_plen_67_part_00